MRLKPVLLATTAVALLSGAQQAAADGLYLSVFGGANLQPDDAQTFSSGSDAIEFNPDTGFVLGGAIGANLDKWARGLRAEAEVSYRRNDLSGSWFTGNAFPPPNSGPVDGNLSTFAIMTNVWYDIDIGNKVRPYIGGGVGWARVRGETAFVTTRCNGSPCNNGGYSATDEREGFAWQIGLGFNYEVAPGVDLGLGYRYFRGPGFDDEFFVGKATMENDSHTVQANLTIGIN